MSQQRLNFDDDDDQDRAERYMRDAPVQHNYTSTSTRAARNAQPRAGTQRWRMLEFVAARGDYGATRNEMERETPMRLCSICAAAKSLLDGGYLEKDGERVDRETAQGNEVLKATDLGRRVLEEHRRQAIRNGRTP